MNTAGAACKVLLRRYHMKGTVKWFNNQKGYGFICDADGHDVFVHTTLVLIWKALRPSTKVQTSNST